MRALERPYKVKNGEVRELMTTTEFANLVGVNKFAIIRDCNKGYLPCFKLSNRFVILAEDYFSKEETDNLCDANPFDDSRFGG